MKIYCSALINLRLSFVVLLLAVMVSASVDAYAVDNTQIRRIDVEEAARICLTLRDGTVTKEVYDLEGVVGGTCNSRRDRLMLNVDMWQGEKMAFAYRLSGMDSLAFNHRYELVRGDTIVIRTRLENFKERPCSYCGYVIELRKYVNPTNELIKATLDKEWQLVAQVRRDEARVKMFWSGVALAVIALVILLFWLKSVYYHFSHDLLTQLRTRKGGEFRIKSKMKFKSIGYYCLLDINGFKNVNDRFGHRAGDRCLQDFAAIIREEFPHCISMRMDGNEFAVFVQNVNREDLNMMMEDFFGRVQDLRIIQDPEYHVTVSVGTAFYDGSGNYEQLFHRADQSLAKSKAHQGNWIT